MKDTLEAINASTDLSCFIIKRLKDGAGIDDLLALLKEYMENEDFKKSINAGAAGVSNIPVEIKAMTAQDGITLGANVLMVQVPKIIEALK